MPTGQCCRRQALGPEPTGPSVSTAWRAIRGGAESVYGTYIYIYMYIFVWNGMECDVM